MKITLMDTIYFLLPSIIGYGSSAFCDIGKNAGDTVKFRPPAFVFGIIWPILFILFGLSWAIAMRNSKEKILCASTYGIGVISLGLWTYVYGCKNMKKQASWVILLSFAALLASYAQGTVISKVCLSPLIAWILFALIMNTTEVQNSKM